VGSGDFAGASDFVFFSNLTRYKLHGEEMHRGRRAIRYDYTVPVEAQAYRIRGQEAEAAVGFHGSFLVDAGTLDLMRLEAYADRIPEALKVASSSMAVDFERIRIGASDFLLPSATELRMTLTSGEESVNATRFSACRHFEAESRLVLDAAPVAAAGGPAKPLVIPPGLAIDSRLLSSISPDVSAVGDPVQAAVDHPVSNHGVVLIPKGAVLNGRIKHLSSHKSPPGSTGSHRWQTEGFNSNVAAPDFSILVLEFNSVAVAGTSTPLHLTLERLGGGLRAADGRTVRAEQTITVKDGGPPNAILHFVPRFSLLPKGFWLRWQTVP
jgi:hypothetical protein